MHSCSAPHHILCTASRLCSTRRPPALPEGPCIAYAATQDRRLDWCLQGGKVTSPDQADMVQLVSVGGEELLWYRAPQRIDVALIRGTTADLDGNVSFEREALFLDSLNQVSSKLLRGEGLRAGSRCS